MKRTKRITAFLLILLLGLTACNTDREPKEVHKVDWVTSPAYLAEDIELPVSTGDLIGCCTDGEYTYVLVDEKVEDEVRSILFRSSLADGETEVLEEYEAPHPPEGVFTSSLGPIIAPDGTLWVYETWIITNYDLPEDFDETTGLMAQYVTGRDEFHHVRQLSPETGREKKLVDLSEAVRAIDQENIWDASSFAVDSKGNIYFARNGGVAVLNGQGKHLFTLETAMPAVSVSGSAGGRLALLPDGTVAALTTLPGGKRAVRTIDSDARSWGRDRYELSAGVDLICSGTGGFLFFFTRGRSLYAWEPDSEEERLLLTWSDIEVDGSVMCSAPLDGGKLSVLTFQYNITLNNREDWYSGRLRLSLLSPTGKKPDDSQITLLYGTFGENSQLRAKIDEFNAAHKGECCIRIRNYAGDGVELFYDADREAARDGAMKLLQAEVMSGRIPDIWDSSLPVDQYAQKGYLEDLWPWIDGDEEIGGRDALMSHVLDCMSMEGKLYKLSDVFSINTIVARTDIAGSRTSWTLEEMMACYDAMPEGSTIMGPYLYQDTPAEAGAAFLSNVILKMNASRWIDWSTGTCSFNSEDFKGMLELCARIAADCTKPYGRDDMTAEFREGRQLIMPAILNKPGDLLYYDAMCGGPENLIDYAAYLNENNIFSQLDPARQNTDGAITCRALDWVDQARQTGMLSGCDPLTADVVIGAVEDGGCASFAGLPSQEGTGSSFLLSQHASMSATCENKEAAWSYIRQFLLPDSFNLANGTGAYSRVGFPIHKATFEEYMKPKWFVDSSGDYFLDADGNRIEAPADYLVTVPETFGCIPAPIAIFQLALNESQMESFMELYNSIGPSQNADSDLVNLIREQALPYFAGDKSLDETADLIQRRATLYVNENR